LQHWDTFLLTRYRVSCNTRIGGFEPTNNRAG
jgi:hypothetical protein